MSNIEKAKARANVLRDVLHQTRKQKERETPGSPHFNQLAGREEILLSWLEWIECIVLDKKIVAVTEDGRKATNVIAEHYDQGEESYKVKMLDGNEEWYHTDRINIKL